MPIMKKDSEPNPKKKLAKIIGYVIENNYMLPVFSSEKEYYRGKKIYKTCEEAKEVLK